MTTGGEGRRGQVLLWYGRRFISELKETVRRPTRLRMSISPRAIAWWGKQFKFDDAPWKQADDQSAFVVRSYRSYNSYLKRQMEKLSTIDMREYDVTFRNVLRERLKRSTHVQPGLSVLCLAARIGTEVKAFRDVGCFAVGIDLNPGGGTEYVLKGDFHDLRFPNHCVDMVFTNSLDHTLDLQRLIDEIKRILRPAGILLTEIEKGFEEGIDPGPHESWWWPRVDDVVDTFVGAGFEVIDRFEFEYPWPGEHVALRSPSHE